MHTMQDIIADHPFFEGLDPRLIELAAGCARNVRFEPGQYLYREGESADRFYTLRHGKVSIEVYSPQRGPITLQTVSPGEVVGWSWLFPPYRCMFDARALEVVRATQFDGACLRTKCESDPALGYALMKRLAHIVSQRLETTRLQLLDVYGNAPTT